MQLLGVPPTMLMCAFGLTCVQVAQDDVPQGSGPLPGLLHWHCGGGSRQMGQW
jgi:hypothetical protein